MGERQDNDAQARRRRERLAEALRDNLKRRKAQQRRAPEPAAPADPKETPDGSH